MVARAQSIDVSAMRTLPEIDAKLLVKYFIYYLKHSNIFIMDIKLYCYSATEARQSGQNL